MITQHKDADHDVKLLINNQTTPHSPKCITCLINSELQCMMKEVIIYTSDPKLIPSHEAIDHHSQNFSSPTK